MVPMETDLVDCGEGEDEDYMVPFNKQVCSVSHGDGVVTMISAYSLFIFDQMIQLYTVIIAKSIAWRKSEMWQPSSVVHAFQDIY